MISARLDYGRHGREVSLPSNCRISLVEPSKGAPIPAAERAVTEALENPIGTPPLATLAAGRRDAAIVISDKTRPVPYRTVLPPVLHTLERAGIARERIEIVVATGLHRANDRDELIEMVGAEIVDRYAIRNHDARDRAAHRSLGRSPRGAEILVDERFLSADLKIITGLIEPHLMAGYSGGRKAVVPGLAAVDTMRTLHGPQMLESNIGPGIIRGNTFHEELLAIVRGVGVDFMLDVTLDRARRITGIFAGDLELAHAAGVAFLEPHVELDLDAPADVVLTCAGGYPLDATLYQSIKGLTAALNLVRTGGTVILLAELNEGVGSHEFVELLRTVRGDRELMQRITGDGFFQIDQWMVQHLCQVLRKARVVIVTDHPPAGLQDVPIEIAGDAEAVLTAAVARAGAQPHVAVIPQGPYVLPTVRGRRYALGEAWQAAA